jgi:hypothetical protein
MDRYTVNGKTQDYVVAARELNADGLNDAQKNWINEHMVFTHGDGFVAAPANTVNNGYPDYTVSDIANIGKPNNPIPVNQPRTYYGQLTTDYAIVGAEGGVAREYDTETTRYTYTGAGGVSVGNLFQRAVFATEYGEANFLFSSEINANSKIMYYRDPLTRVQKAAPFLTTDTKAYPAVVDGRIVYSRRLHDRGQLPVRAGGDVVRRHQQLAGRAGGDRAGQHPGLLHPQLRQGDGGRL